LLSIFTYFLFAYLASIFSYLKERAFGLKNKSKPKACADMEFFFTSSYYAVGDIEACHCEQRQYYLP